MPDNPIALGRHDDAVYEAIIKINGVQSTQRIDGPRNEKLALEHYRASIAANNKAHPDNKIELVSYKRIDNRAQVSGQAPLAGAPTSFTVPSANPVVSGNEFSAGGKPPVSFPEKAAPDKKE